MNNKNRFQCVGFFKRVMRLCGQLQTGHNGVPLKPEYMKYDINTVSDRVLTFFIFCHHIKDWIINDDLVDPQVKEKVEPFIEANSCLKFFANNIANGIKHLKLKRKRSPALLIRIRSQRRIVSAKLSEVKKINPLEDPPVLIKDSASFETDQGRIEAFDLATECVDKWRKFIEDNITNP